MYDRVARADGGHDGDNWNARRKEEGTIEDDGVERIDCER